MTIRKGEPWGEQYEAESLPAPIEHFATLGELAEEAYTQHLHGNSLHAYAFGDLLTPFGSLSQGNQLSQRNKVGLYPVDLGLCRGDDGDPKPFIAHAVARRRFWSGEFAAVLNVGWHGAMNVAPKAHLNDGLLDVVQGALPLRQRLQARKRAQSGTHLPHPSLSYRRCKTTTLELKKPTPLLLDGEKVGVYSSLSICVIPDALLLVV